MTDLPRAGTTLAGFRLERQLGQGAMGVVYMAEQLRLNRKVALKLLAPDHALDESFRRRFEQEFELLAALDHPHVIPIYDAGEADGWLYLAMKYVEGFDLLRLVQAGPLDPERAVTIVSEVADALDAAHAQGLIHRDVKPANVLIERRPGRPDHTYLSDFGLVKRMRSELGLTSGGMMLGTPAYISPEQVQEGPVDARSDVYALGCLLFECLTAQLPFARDTYASMLTAHLYEEPRRVSEVRAGLPPAMDEVVATAMAKDPAGRYPTCGELAAAARAALDDTGLPEPAAVPAPPAPGRPAEPAPEPAPPGGAARNRSRPLLALGVALVVAVAAGVALLAGGGGGGGGERVTGPASSTLEQTTAAPTSTTAAGQSLLGPVGRIRPAVVLASLTAPPGVEASGAPVTYDPGNTIDGNPATAWRVPGDGRGVVLSVRLPARTKITRVGLLPGYAKVDPVDGVDRFPQNRRIVRVLYGFGSGTAVEARFADAPTLQFTAVDAETDNFTIEILETTANPARDFTAISEIAVEGAAVTG